MRIVLVVLSSLEPGVGYGGAFDPRFVRLRLRRCQPCDEAAVMGKVVSMTGVGVTTTTIIRGIYARCWGEYTRLYD